MFSSIVHVDKDKNCKLLGSIKFIVCFNKISLRSTNLAINIFGSSQCSVIRMLRDCL